MPLTREITAYASGLLQKTTQVEAAIACSRSQELKLGMRVRNTASGRYLDPHWLKVYML